ncbi:MAG: autotransporter outer membrane beta-barrel domain-containing protein [Gammaproteobacteria bacterium HGW-Gammaproteobacteria-10]|nr:MAG: autotransporter outer membrane beta-barrel domain-containing protein [Gammaproteobacteria bacterium HGW-Gammaproteobacteria-10]
MLNQSKAKPSRPVLYSTSLSSLMVVSSLTMPQLSFALPSTNDTSLFNSSQKNLISTLQNVYSSCILPDESISDSSLCTQLNSISNILFDPEQDPLVFQQLSPEQIIQQGTQATRITAGQLGLVESTLKNRLSKIHSSYQGNIQASGFQFYHNGQAVSALGGAAGDEDFGLFGHNLGVWLNMNIRVGDVNNTFEQVGFNYDNYGFTGGADYKLAEDLVLGGAFSYLRSNADFSRNQGETTTDTYTGSIYGTYYFWDNFHLDAIASYGGNQYDTVRRINFQNVSTEAIGSTGGNQHAYSLGIGYDFSYGAFSLTPYFRGNYVGLSVDSFSESGGAGFGMAFSDQNVDSWTTTLGSETSYAIGLPFGVVVAQFRAEWHHQYKDGSRNIGASFVDDPTGQRFNIVSQSADRNFATIGTSLSGTFADGLSGFVSYDVMLGYQDISSHSINFGARMEF